MEKMNEISKVNLVDLLNKTDSFNSQSCESLWTFHDCSKGHLIFLIISMILTYIVQISGFVLTLVFSKPNELSYHKSAALTQPYFERTQVIVVAFLVHFQFYAFYLEPFSILKLISRDLHYTNITATMITGAILLSNINYSNQFIETFHMNSLLALFVFTNFTYFKVYKSIVNKTRVKFSRVLGFNVLYSFFLPFVAIELGETVIRVAYFYDELPLAESSRVIIFTCFYFMYGVCVVYYFRDTYMGFGFFFNLLGIFVVQSYNICNDYENYCNIPSQVVSMILAVIIAGETCFLLYRYPLGYCFHFKKRRF